MGGHQVGMVGPETRMGRSCVGMRRSRGRTGRSRDGVRIHQVGMVGNETEVVTVPAWMVARENSTSESRPRESGYSKGP